MHLFTRSRKLRASKSACQPSSYSSHNFSLTARKFYFSDVNGKIIQQLKRSKISPSPQMHKDNNSCISAYNVTPSSSSNLFKRFRFRLVEALMPFKQRAEVSNQSLTLLLPLIRNIEKALYQLQQGQLIFQDFLEEVQKSFVCFKESLNESSQSELPSPLNAQDREQGKTNHSMESDNKRKKTEPDYHMKLRKTIEELNLRFKTLSCLDLDYGYFRSSFFEGKNNQRALLDQNLERNKLAKTQRIAYSREFRQYLQKREKRKLLKRTILLSRNNGRGQNAITKSFRLHENYTSSGAQFSLSGRKDDSRTGYLISQKPKSHDKSRKMRRLGDSSYQQNIEEELLSHKPQNYIPRKAEYEMKSIVITAKNLECFGTTAMTQNQPKCTIRQFDVSRRRNVRSNEAGLLQNFKEALPRFRLQQ